MFATTQMSGTVKSLESAIPELEARGRGSGAGANQPRAEVSNTCGYFVVCFLILQHWDVFKYVTEVFILVPALLGLKGNLEMTLASRLSTAVSTQGTPGAGGGRWVGEQKSLCTWGATTQTRGWSSPS